MDRGDAAADPPRAPDPFSKWGDLDTGHARMTLADFAAEGKKKAELKPHQTFALRLYTCTPVSFALNAPLRNYKTDDDGKVTIKEDHPFPLTISTIRPSVLIPGLLYCQRVPGSKLSGDFE